MIEKIEISNFKNISNLTLELENLNVLVGSNNSGKSSILQAIQFAISVAQTSPSGLSFPATSSSL